MNMKKQISFVDICVYVLLFPSCILCDQKRPTRAKITVEYTDDVGNIYNKDYTKNTYYGMNSIVNTAAIQGRLVLAQRLTNHGDNTSELGCEPVNNRTIPKCEPWVMLVKRGNCSFNEKIYFAAKIAKATAVIIYNDVETDSPFIMDTVGDYNVEDVVAVATSYKHGRELVTTLENYNDVHVNITKYRFTWLDLIDLIEKHHNESTNITTLQPNESSGLYQPIMSLVLIVISLAGNAIYCSSLWT